MELNCFSAMTDEEDDESCLTRQFNESAVLKSIYGDQLVLLSEVGKPLECIIHLWRDNGSVESSANFPRFDLHVKCPEDYPHAAPYIQLKNWKKIPNGDISTLRDELLVLADSLKGEVLIHELAGHCENFLYNHDPPETCSLYEGMMQRNRDLEEIRAKELQQKRADEQRKREEMMSHIHSEQQAVKKALRRKSTKSETVEDDVEKTDLIDRRSMSPEGALIPSQSVPEDDFIEEFINRGHRSSRFQNDFEQIQKLGKGTFGEVWKVRNRLDSGQYAIKKIELNPSKKQLFKKITREVELLSRLNHENVVRYYNSWFEVANVDTALKSSGDSMESTITSPYKNSRKNEIDMLPCAKEMTIDWNDIKPTDEDDSASWIAFGDDQEMRISGEESSEGEDVVSEESNEIVKPLLYMYIQMELCEKSTLRVAIDEGLYNNGERVWRLFREIVEGLCHIHNQGIMHRDLKPVNIFLGSNDQVKIGDFGLATTSKSQKATTAQNQDGTDSSDITESTFLSDSSVKDVSHTGHAGTPYYKAPELANDLARPVYNKKVDIYSLGIIFFEMNYPMNTGMERNKILTNLRASDVKFPENFPYPEDSYEYKMIKMMLSHNIEERPSSQDILAHDCLGTVKLDEGEVKDMVHRTLCNPQSKDYKFLIASCFNQKMPAAFEATYNMSTFRTFWSTSSLNVVEERLRNIFHHYGATSFSPPLLTPGQAPKNSVSLMTNVGGIVHATPDLQIPFARYVVQNPSVVTFKRYTLEKVYREMPVGIHPREVYECAFDIVSSSFGDQMPDIELFAVIKDILKAFPHLTRRNCVIYINHSVLITTLLETCVASTPTGLMKTELKNAVLRAMTETTSRTELQKNLKSLNLPDSAINIVMQWVELEGHSDIEDILTGLVKKPELLTRCKMAIKQLQRVIKDCELLEMPCPVIIKPPLVRNPSQYTGILFQVKCDKSVNSKVKGKTTECCVMIAGGRYDGLLEELKQKIPSKDITKPVRYITGFTMNLEHLVLTVDDDGRPTVVDVLFCSLGTVTMTSERLTLLKELWGLNVKVYFSNTLQSMDEIQTLCDQLGVSLLLLMKPNDTGVRARLTNKESKSIEKRLHYTEVVDYVSKLFKQESTCLAKHAINIPIIQFISLDKITISLKNKQEAQINENLSTLIQKFSSNVRIEVLVLVPVKGDMIKFLSSVIEPEDVMKSLEPACKRYPLYKKLILKTLKHIDDSRTANPNSVIILYSLYDNIYKLIM
uniref:non-specific serine/threonine protein kinase n=2 Tax=Lygus hesperus TaxID=30085 RepID=A0A0A9YXK3_LYGHE